MKKVVFLILVLAFTSATAVAQKIDVGILAGFGGSTLATNKRLIADWTLRRSYQINLQLRQELTKVIGLSIEPGFISRGSNAKYVNGNSGYIEINYVHLPMMVSYAPVSGSSNKLAFVAGPEVGYLLSSYGKIDGSDRVKTTGNDNRADIGINLGLVYQLTSKLDIGFRFYRGFLSTSGEVTVVDQDGNVVDKVTTHNQGVHLTAAYTLN